MNSSKFKYHDPLAKKLDNPKIEGKTYWSILETFVNGSKIPLIPPLSVGNRLATDVLAKANLFNDLFSKHCSTIVSRSSLPTALTVETENRLSTTDFSTDDIIKFIKALDPNMAHGGDGMSIRMIKLCAFLIFNLCILFLKTVLKMNVFPMNGRRQILFLPTRKEISN